MLILGVFACSMLLSFFFCYFIAGKYYDYKNDKWLNKAVKEEASRSLQDQLDRYEDFLQDKITYEELHKD